MTQPIDVQGLGAEELAAFVGRLQQRPYRARQLTKWLYQKGVLSYDEMTDLPAPFRALLKEQFPLAVARPLSWLTAPDGTKKVLLELGDGARIEAVYMPYDERRTICLSTQAGCALGCRFCATGAAGFTRNLTAGEIIAQLLTIYDEIPGARGANVVLMGMGEPLLNTTNVIQSLRIMLADWGIGLSKRRVTVSTAGIIPGIVELGKAGLGVNLSLSLNAPNDSIRSQLMPINLRYPLDEVLAACRNYPLAPGRRITYEYILVRDLNDQEQHAQQLARLLSRRQAKINLIPLNPSVHCSLEPSPQEVIARFQEILFEANISAFVRDSKGSHIQAACGQLAGRKTDEPVA